MLLVEQPVKSKDSFKKKANTTKYLTQKQHRPHQHVKDTTSDKQLNNTRSILSADDKLSPQNIYD